MIATVILVLCTSFPFSMNTETKAIFLKNLSELNISNLPKVLELDWNLQEILMITEHVSGNQS